MLRVLLTVFGALLTSTLLVYALESFLARHWAQQVATGQLRERFRPTFILIEDRLRGVAPEQQAAAFAQLIERFNYPAELLTLEAAATRMSLSPADIGLLRDDRIFVTNTPDSARIAKQILVPQARVVLLDPPGLQQPFYLKMRFYYALGALLTFLALYILSRWYWRDLRTLKGVTARVAAGDFNARVDLSNGSLLRPLANDLNHMSAQLDGLMKSHRELVSAVSHEMRHPIARMHFHHQLARDATTSTEVAEKLALLAKDIDELDELSDEVLTYARLKRVDPLESPAWGPTAEWLNDAVVRVEEFIAAERLSVSVVNESRLEQASVIAPLMQRATTNLLLNAVRHARSSVILRLTASGGQFVLEVDDDGPGIAEAHRLSIFEPFVRLDRSRTRASGGYGMGLAIVERIARWHGGHASVETSSSGGARFVIRWPIDGRRLPPQVAT
jgi:signal transduction histidine kinase